jgi:hypothetical protein
VEKSNHTSQPHLNHLSQLKHLNSRLEENISIEKSGRQRPTLHLQKATQTTKMDSRLTNLPPEIFQMIMSELVKIEGMRKAWRYRNVSRK